MIQIQNKLCEEAMWSINQNHSSTSLSISNQNKKNEKRKSISIRPWVMNKIFAQNLFHFEISHIKVWERANHTKSYPRNKKILDEVGCIGQSSIKKNATYSPRLKDTWQSQSKIPTFGPYTPQPWVSCDYTVVNEQKKRKFANLRVNRFQLTSPRNQHRSSCNFSQDFTTIFDFENTRYCALPSREERYRLIPFVEESSVPIEDKMSNPKVFYHLNNLSFLEGASLVR
ncbi:hypothetical protein Anas_08764 [Armadillidium nasatum]|uniref:Uncharacterized protein n=1 Tax=Armadillidium nasatum TaxID=96803 RepID=A0A5N5SVT5_9CRUS|nr:hypothetical protein Anas_08764 [Armadillidium nasatum]